MVLEPEHPRHHEGQDDADEGAGDLRDEPLEDQDQHQRADPHQRGGAVGLVEVAEEVAEPLEEVLARDGHAGELAELADEEGEAEAHEVADQRGTGQQVGDEPEPRDRCDEQQQPHQDSEGGAGGDVLVSTATATVARPAAARVAVPGSGPMARCREVPSKA